MKLALSLAIFLSFRMNLNAEPLMSKMGSDTENSISSIGSLMGRLDVDRENCGKIPWNHTSRCEQFSAHRDAEFTKGLMKKKSPEFRDTQYLCRLYHKPKPDSFWIPEQSDACGKADSDRSHSAFKAPSPKPRRRRIVWIFSGK